MKRLLAGGRVVDPAEGRDGIFDLLVDDGRIGEVGVRVDPAGAEVFDCRGKIVMPGAIDLHVHLREPGFEYKETIVTGVRAAAAGGFTAVCAMPNTDPVNDNRAVTRWMADRGAEAGGARLYPIGAITRGRAGVELAEYGDMKDAGAVAVSDDGSWVTRGDVMRTALTYARLIDLPVATHAEDETLSGRGAMTEGAVATRLGLSSQPPEAESIAVSRDLALAEKTGGRIHICHISTRRSIELVREARRRGVAVTCEVTPHHLFLTDDDVDRSGFDTATKMNPPLRSADDSAALVEALVDGTIDAIATDHAPHHDDEKAVDYESAPFGVAGLETALSLVHNFLVVPGRLPLSRFVELVSSGPARAFSLPGGRLRAGDPGDIVVFDPSRPWEVDARQFVSRGRNTPFSGWKLAGRPSATFVGGVPVFLLP